MLQFPHFRFNPRRRSKTSYPGSIHRFRGLLAIGLVALLFLAPLSLTVSGQQPGSGSKIPQGDYFILYRSADGDAVCREATLAERREMGEVDTQKLKLHQINHLPSESYAKSMSATTGENDLPAHLTIILRATAQLEANAPAKAAFIRAAATWENQVMSPVTIYVDVDFGTTNSFSNPPGAPWGANILGSTQSPSISSVPYSSVRNNLLVSASTAAETSVYNALPATSVPTDLGDVSTVSVSSSIARALGFLDPTALSTDLAAKIGFNSNFTYDFDPSNGISGGTDFEAVATHEIGHALGFTSRSGSTSGTPPPPTSPSIWDLFRFRTGATAGTFTTAQRIMTIGGPDGPSSGFLQYFFVPGITDAVPPFTELGLSTGGPTGSSNTNGDGNQSSHWKQASLNGFTYIGIMDPKIPSNTLRQITNNDTNALNIFGYNLDNSNPPPPPPPPPTPPANDNFASAQTISGCTGSVNGTNVGATHEAGEPSHDPLGNAGASSVWYQWQAPSTDSVTITTAGSNYDTMLGVYTGSSVNGLTTIIQNDDVDTQGGNVTSTVTFTATTGTVYKIAVDGWDGDAGNIVLNWTESPCTQTATVQLSAAGYTVGEGDVSLQITVNRIDTSGAATVGYQTADTDTFTFGCAAVNNQAFGRCDFATTVGTLSFAAGEASKTFSIPIINDSYAEGNETFSIQLSNPTGASFGGPPTATLTIIDNETVTGPNPILQGDNAGIAFFVRQHYLDFLAREPEAGEPWSAILRPPPAPPGCANQFNVDPANPSAGCDRLFVSGQFFGSPEFKFKGGYVIIFYRVAFNRLPTYAEFANDLASVTGTTAPEVFAKRAAFANNFVLRPEFVALPGMTTNTDYVNTLMGHYSLSSITTPDPANPDGTVKVPLTSAELTDRLNGVGGTLTRAQVLRAIVQSDEVVNIEALNVFVASQYYGYLRRTPDSGGFTGWINYLTANPNDFRTMVNGFMNSVEYRLRFGPP